MAAWGYECYLLVPKDTFRGWSACGLRSLQIRMFLPLMKETGTSNFLHFQYAHHLGIWSPRGLVSTRRHGTMKAWSEI